MNKKLNIFYIWGYGGSPQSNSIEFLKTLLDSDKYNVISDYYAQYDPEQALIDLNEYIKEYHIDLIIASSLGAYLALQIPGIPKILINPCLHPENELEKLTQEVQLADEEGNPKYDENGAPVIDVVPAVPEHIINFYKDYIKIHDVWENFSNKEIISVVMGTHDEVLGDIYVNEISKHCSNIIRSNQGHSNTLESLKTYVLPEITKIFPVI